MGTNYEHLSAEERATIMLMRGEGCSLRAMARRLHRAPSTISRELARNSGDTSAYDARQGLHVVSCGKQHRHWGIAGANGLAGRCLSLDMRR
jgi:IS30 family transposase